ncbi:Wax ester synthase/acyl-CoA:diacylglycerol acyltransferase [Minicystis rosea]|nr:Wax ester synthase/acyl-CoA:diacylglycerol acyltransferase [Minicystis rosea]
MSARKSLNPLDRLFLAGETHESLMHVGVLIPFSPPAHGASELIRSLIDELKRQPRAFPPWNLKLRHPALLSSPLQAWVEDPDFDVDYHVRRSALPSPGDERELGILVSRLHSNKIDFHRPPWEVHFIEGLEGGRFAMYFKVHHALVDGYTGMRLLIRSLSTDPEERDKPMFFSLPPAAPKQWHDEGAEPTLGRLMEMLHEQVGATKDAGRALVNVLKATREKDRSLVSPLAAPRSVLNQKISRNRRFATQQYSAERLRRVAKAHDGTLNDVVLALTGGALRRLLAEQGALPDQALTAMLPVNIRPKDDPGGGNAVGAILATLATDIDDPARRLETIVASTKRAKGQLQGLSRSAIMQYSTLLLTPALISQIPGAVGRVRPTFNLVVSNVPGPETPLYFRGFRAEALYPLSIPFHGYGLNVTVNGYAGTLCFGFIGCRDGLPHLQRLAVYGAEALEELEASLPGRAEAHEAVALAK